MANPLDTTFGRGCSLFVQPARPNSPSEQALRLPTAVSKLFINDGILTDNRSARGLGPRLCGLPGFFDQCCASEAYRYPDATLQP